MGEPSEYVPSVIEVELDRRASEGEVLTSRGGRRWRIVEFLRAEYEGDPDIPASFWYRAEERP